MAINHLATLAAMSGEINGYTDAAAARKRRMHLSGRAFLKRLATDAGMQPGAYDIRSNPAGIAVSGEVTLHGDRLYVQLFEPCTWGDGLNLMFRACDGRRDYCGKRNNFKSMVGVMAEYAAFVAYLRQINEGKAL